MPGPPDRQTRVDIDWASEMRRLDPDLSRDSRIEPEYVFTARVFEIQTAISGPYDGQP